MDIPRNGTVLLPAYTALSAVQAFRVYGLNVEYFSVSEDLTLPVRELSDRIAEVDPDLFMIHHYFSFPDPNYREIVDLARDTGATIIEDCARALFNRDEDGRLLGSTGDVAIFSLRKVLPIPHGGLVVSPVVDSFSSPISTSSEYRGGLASAAIAAQRFLDAPVAKRAGVQTLVRRLNGHSETNDPSLDHDWAGTSPGRLSRLGLAHCDPDTIATERRDRYRALRGSLATLDGFEILTPHAHSESSPFGVALRIDGGKHVRDHVYDTLMERGLPAEVLQWPMPPALDPGPEFPGAASLRDSILVLPTHQQLPERAIPLIPEAIADALASVQLPAQGVRV